MLLGHTVTNEVRLVRRKHAVTVRCGHVGTNVATLRGYLAHIPQECEIDEVELHDDETVTITFYEERVAAE